MTDDRANPAAPNEIAEPSDSALAEPSESVEAAPDVEELLRHWLSRRSKATGRAYGRDIAHFARHVGADSPADAVSALIAGGHAAANRLALGYLTSMREIGLSPATCNRRLSALRSVVSLARTLGYVAWGIDVGGDKVSRYRDTRGPGLRAVQLMIRIAGSQPGFKGLRDVVLLLLLFVLGLRRGEVSALDVEHYDRAGQRLWVQGKGKSQRSSITVPAPVVEALQRYLDARDAQPGDPLITNLDRASKGARLTSGGIYRVVRHLGELAGIPGTVSPHRIRHSAITHALDASGGDIRRVQKFSRHARPDTVLVYDDARQDLGGQVATMLAAALGVSESPKGTADGDAEVINETAEESAETSEETNTSETPDGLGNADYQAQRNGSEQG